MSVRIQWAPSTYPTVASYDILVASASTGPFTFLANVSHTLPGANYDTVNGIFFYNDPTGTLTSWYELVVIDSAGNRSLPSAPIEPAGTVPTLGSTVKVDHNYGTPGALRYQTAAGQPVEQATIRVYTKVNFDQGITDNPIAITMTNALGNWAAPVILPTGFTYTVVFSKDGLYGPDTQEITV